ncbi:MAG: FMN-binding protein, partial [Ruminococcus callidus]|nr:FMN-binding protein [Ruminococcus callidus]
MKKWENPKKILPVLGFLPTAVLAVCIAVSLGDYTAPVLSLDAAGSETGTQTGTLTTEKRKERKTAAVMTKAPALAGTPVSESGTYRDGVYTGTGTGFGGQTTVQVTVSGGKITDIQVLSSKDDSPYLQNACALLQNIIASQSTNVDAVSGATYSSAGLIEAVRNALANAATGEVPAETTLVPTAKTEPPATTVPAVPQETGKFPYPDGVYTGSGEGYGGTTKIELTLKNGTIQKIHVVSNEDDEAFFKRAETLISLVIQRQSTDVDAVSGAT